MLCMSANFILDTENLKCAEKELSIDGDVFLLNDVSEYVVF